MKEAVARKSAIAIVQLFLACVRIFAQSNSVPVDFVSTHEYPTDIMPYSRDVMIGVTVRVPWRCVRCLAVRSRVCALRAI